ncbi:asparagine synthase (glutamine-hydrolyzing) [Sphingomonas sp.]|uniref:asparagine synthase (glutamine-hydrolyzing) n=1 Tax=Sphingomonas sp. TaxID=28214 RepID=UPI0025EFBF60|nr:asparagine synthase (glutamine-hydrolyzing) [Sphingomonas sp.]MBV9527820.1 asparagine synthase (glutamine-hydrolyzing) [Sphingomonas sp.]
MCGIAGFIEPRPLDGGAAALAASMANAIEHRGPDDSGTWIDADAGIALGHRRLSIIDLSPAGHQPMASPSGRFVLVYNGELYNFREIRAELDEIAGGIQWRGESDTEVLLAAMDQWGVRAALDRLNGMFAFAAWDRSSRILTLARDRMGEKPLYYGTSGGVFMFGSELKALQAHPAFTAELDRDSISSMLRYDYVPAPHSIWKGIAKLEPAHFMEIADGGRTVGKPRAYWDLRKIAARGVVDQLPDGPELTSDLESRLLDAVGRRMVADVPLGAFLSGGIDSSLIVAMMQAQSDRPVRTFTIGFDVAKFDEAPQAKAIAGHLGTDHTELYVTARDALDVIPRIPAIWDEPFGDSSQIPTFLVSAMARRDVTVALSGDGGDELFGGYARYKSTPRIWSSLSRYPRGVRAAVAQGLGAIGGGSAAPGALGRAAIIVGSGTFEDLYQWKLSRAQRADPLVLGASEHVLAASGPITFVDKPADKMMVRDQLHHLPDDIMSKVDRAAMAVSLETRAPFLDHHLVEYSWRLPLSAKLNADAGKLILRRLLRRHLPDSIIDRPKMGFSVPVEEWLRGPLRGWGEELLREQRLRREGILEPKRVRRLWTQFLAGHNRRDRIVWNLLMFQLWHETAGAATRNGAG